MKNISFVLIVLSLFIVLFVDSCTPSYQRSKLYRDDVIKNNRNGINSLSYGMTLQDATKIMKGKHSLNSNMDNPIFTDRILGMDSSYYYIQLYEYSDPGYKGNIVFRDQRYYPIIFQNDKIIGLDWNDYEKIIGSSFVINESGKVKSRATGNSRNNDNYGTTSGTGFLISNDGHVVTNYHVVDKARKISVYSPMLNMTFDAAIITQDINNDLVILKILDTTNTSNRFPKINYRIVEQDEIKIGQEVFTLGFPLSTYLGSTARLSNGIVNSKYGIQDDPRTYQISNPLQPGNSGGPLFNRKGNLVGIVVASLNASFFLYNAGTIPQNVNFAIKSDYLRILIKSVALEEPKQQKDLLDDFKLESLVEILNEYVMMIICEQ